MDEKTYIPIHPFSHYELDDIIKKSSNISKTIKDLLDVLPMNAHQFGEQALFDKYIAARPQTTRPFNAVELTQYRAHIGRALQVRMETTGEAPVLTADPDIPIDDIVDYVESAHGGLAYFKKKLNEAREEVDGYGMMRSDFKVDSHNLHGVWASFTEMWECENGGDDIRWMHVAFYKYLIEEYEAYKAKPVPPVLDIPIDDVVKFVEDAYDGIEFFKRQWQKVATNKNGFGMAPGHFKSDRYTCYDVWTRYEDWYMKTHGKTCTPESSHKDFYRYVIDRYEGYKAAKRATSVPAGLTADLVAFYETKWLPFLVANTPQRNFVIDYHLFFVLYEPYRYACQKDYETHSQLLREAGAAAGGNYLASKYPQREYLKRRIDELMKQEPYVAKCPFSDGELYDILVDADDVDSTIATLQTESLPGMEIEDFGTLYLYNVYVRNRPSETRKYNEDEILAYRTCIAQALENKLQQKATVHFTGTAVTDATFTVAIDFGAKPALTERLYYNPPGTPTPTQEKETMSATTSLKFNTVNYVSINGGSPVDVSQVSADVIFNLIENTEAEIERLSKITNKPKALEARIADLQSGIERLVAEVDSRDTK